MTMHDYLDSKASYLNFVNGRPYSLEYKKIARDRWSKLPVYHDRSKVKEIFDSLVSCNVTIIISATGSGKSVIVPRLAMKYLIDTHKSSRRVPKLGMTFPKSVLAMESAKYASKTWDVVLGEEVGYQFRGSPPSSHGSKTRALFMTDGTLYTMSRHDHFLEAFDLVIIDEAHERSMQTDLLVARLRTALIKRPAFRVVIMSATIDPILFESYFNETGLTSKVVHIAGQPMFDIKHHWELKQVGDKDLMDVAVNRVKHAFVPQDKQLGSSTTNARDIIVFVATTKEVKTGCQLFHKETRDGSIQDVSCEGLYRKLKDDLKEVVIHGIPEPPFKRKLIFATPIAESSITLPLLSKVIDSGLQLTSRWLPQEQATEIVRQMTSKAQISQRVGRVGRVAPGEVYHLYTKAQYASLRPFPEPSILQTDLTEHFIAELCIDGSSVRTVSTACNHLLSPPDSAHTASSLRTLRQLGLLIPCDTEEVISHLGRIVQEVCTSFQMSLSRAMLMIGGAIVGCKDDALILACILEEIKKEFSELWSSEAFASREYLLIVKEHVDRFSDHVSLIQVYHTIYNGEPDAHERSILNLSTWNRIETRIMKYKTKYAMFDIHRHIDVKSKHMSSFLPPPPSFACDLIRAVAFSLRHHQLIFRSKGVRSKFASSVGPMTSVCCEAVAVLASQSTRPSSCRGGIYEDLLVINQTKSFSLITWII